MHGIGNVDVVGTGLRHHNHTDHRHTVHFHVAFQVARTEFGASDVAQSDGTVAGRLHNQVVEFLGTVHLSHGADTQFHGVTFNATRRQFHVLAVECLLHVHRRNAITGHFNGVEPQSHTVTLFAPNLHAAHLGNGLQLFFHGEVGNFAEFQQRPLVALYGHHQNGACISIGFRHRRGVAVAWQVALCSRHFVAHVVGCRFQVDREFKLHGDATVSLLADARQTSDTRNTVDILFQRFGNLVFNNVGIGTGIRTTDRDDRVIDRRKFAHAQIQIADDTEYQDNQCKHGGQYRAAYA